MTDSAAPDRMTDSAAPDRGLAAATAARVDHAVAVAQRTWRCPGVSAGLVRDGQLVHSVHVGSARLDPPTAAGDHTAYLIGSVTKTFTAVLVMQLRDEGRLHLDDPLERFLAGSAHGRLTIRGLLSHLSGLQREPVGRIWETLDNPDSARLLEELADARAVLAPGEAFHYSNLAYALLGQVVETLDGRPWEQALRARVLDPLGMTETGLTPAAGHALGYLVHPFSGVARPEPVVELRATAPMGGLWSTVADLTRYAAFLADPDPAVLVASGPARGRRLRQLLGGGRADPAGGRPARPRPRRRADAAARLGARGARPRPRGGARVVVVRGRGVALRGA